MKTLEEIQAALAELRKEMPKREDGSEAIYPRIITGIDWPDQEKMLDAASFSRGKIGAWVKIRPCDDNKTYLGVYLGDFASTLMANFPASGDINLDYALGNPAIYVPDLKRIVRGYESWWGVVESPDDLKEITDATIDNVWYVRALKDLAEKEPGDATEGS
jgi:hypothetical protein